MEAGSSTESGSSSMLTPGTRNALDVAERIARNAEMEILEIGSVLQRRPRRSLKIRTYKDDPPLDDQEEQLLYIKELVLSKFLETEHDEDQQNFKKIPDQDPREETKKLSVPRIDGDPAKVENEKPVDENVLDTKGPGSDLSKNGRKFVDAKRQTMVDEERLKRLENFCVQIPPAVSIDRKLKTQKLMELNIPPDPGFVEGNTNVASFEYFHGVREKRKERLVKISEERTWGKFVGEPKIRLEGKTVGKAVRRTRIRFKDELAEPISDKARAESGRGNGEESEKSLGDRDETVADKENKGKKSEEDKEKNETVREKDNKIEDKQGKCERFVILQNKEGEETSESKNVEITGEIGCGTSIGHSSKMKDSNRPEISDGTVESADEREQQGTITIIQQQQQQLKSNETQDKNVNEQKEGKSQHFERILENPAAKNHGGTGENLEDRFRDTDERFSRISAKYGVRTVLRKDSDSAETSIDDSLDDDIRLYRPSVGELDGVIAGYREAIETVIRSNRSVDRFLAGSIKYLSPFDSDKSEDVLTSKLLEPDRNVDPGKEDSVAGNDFASCKTSRFEGKEQTDSRKGPASILKKDGARDCMRKAEASYCGKMADDFGKMAGDFEKMEGDFGKATENFRNNELHGKYSKWDDFWQSTDEKMENYKEPGRLLENESSSDFSDRDCKLRFAAADSCKIVDNEPSLNKGGSLSTIINFYDIMKPENFKNILIREKENLVLRLLQSKKQDIENDSKDTDGNFECVISKQGSIQNKSKIDPKVAEREENINKGNFEIGVLRKEPEILGKENLPTEELNKSRSANRQRNAKIDTSDMSKSPKSVELGEDNSKIISESSNSKKKMDSSEDDSKIISERSTTEKSIDLGGNDCKIVLSEMSNFQKTIDQRKTNLKIVSEKSNCRTDIGLDENNPKISDMSVSQKREESTDGSLAEIPNIKSDRENSAEKNSKTESENRKIFDDKMKIANESPEDRIFSAGNSSEDFQTKNESDNKNIVETKSAEHSKTKTESVGQSQPETKSKMAAQISENPPTQPEVSQTSENLKIHPEASQPSKNIPRSANISQNSTDSSKNSQDPGSLPAPPKMTQHPENTQIPPRVPRISKNSPPSSRVLSPVPKSSSITEPSRGEAEKVQEREPDRPKSEDQELQSSSSSKRSSPIQKNGHHRKTSLRESTTLRSVLGGEPSRSILEALDASCIEENSRKILTGDSSLRGSILKKFANFRGGPQRIFCSTFASGDSSCAEKNFRSLSSSSGTESTKTETENSRSEGEFCVSSSYSIGEVKIKNATIID